MPFCTAGPSEVDSYVSRNQTSLLSPLVAIWKSLPLGMIGVSAGWRLAFAWAPRMRWDSPLVTTTLAWCDSRSSRPTAVVFGQETSVRLERPVAGDAERAARKR
jgi:hypothetical protein